MNEQRPPDGRPTQDPQDDRQVERDSQLSAMFDGELSAAECELLARRLSRDEALRAQWSRYAKIGAALRAERGVALNDRVAWRVQSALAQEPSYGDAGSADGAAVAARSDSFRAGLASRSSRVGRWVNFTRPVAGASIAAGVAAVSILWLRAQGPAAETLAANDPAPASESIVLQPEVASVAQVEQAPESAPASSGESDRYSTPAPRSQNSIAPPARFANYVVAHSEYSGPLARRMALLGIVGMESQAEGEESAATEADASDGAPGAGAADAP